MVDRIRIRGYIKKTNLTNGCIGQKFAARHDRSRPEWIWHTEEYEFIKNNCVMSATIVFLKLTLTKPSQE